MEHTERRVDRILSDNASCAFNRYVGRIYFISTSGIAAFTICAATNEVELATNGALTSAW